MAALLSLGRRNLTHQVVVEGSRLRVVLDGNSGSLILTDHVAAKAPAPQAPPRATRCAGFRLGKTLDKSILEASDLSKAASRLTAK